MHVFVYYWWHCKWQLRCWISTQTKINWKKYKIELCRILCPWNQNNFTHKTDFFLQRHCWIFSSFAIRCRIFCCYIVTEVQIVGYFGTWIEPASSSGKLVNNQQHTRRHITEDAKLKYKMFTRKYNSIHSNYYDLLNVTDVPNIYALPYIVNIFLPQCRLHVFSCIKFIA